MDTLTKAKLKSKLLAIKTRLMGEEKIDEVRKEIADARGMLEQDARNESPEERAWWRDISTQLELAERKVRDKSQDAVDILREVLDRMQKRLDKKF